MHFSVSVALVSFICCALCLALTDDAAAQFSNVKNRLCGQKLTSMVKSVCRLSGEVVCVGGHGSRVNLNHGIKDAPEDQPVDKVLSRMRRQQNTMNGIASDCCEKARCSYRYLKTYCCKEDDAMVVKN